MHGGGGGMDPRVHGIGWVWDLRSRGFLVVFFFFFFFFVFFFVKNDILFSLQSRTEDLTHNVRGLCPRLSIHVSSVYCSKIDLSF